MTDEPIEDAESMSEHPHSIDPASEERAEALVESMEADPERTIAISDACGGYFGVQGGCIRVYGFDRIGDYEAILADGRSDDPEWLAQKVKDEGELVEEIRPSFTLPV